MPDKKVDSCLNDWFIRLSQSMNIEYLALVDEKGKVLVSAGDFGLINREDAENLLKTYFTKPEHMLIPGDVNDIHIVKQGAVECFILPINGAVQLIAISSIERPSVLIRIMLTEMFTAREEMTENIKKEWKTPPQMLKNQIGVVEQMPVKIDSSGNEDGNKKTSLEDLITSTSGGSKIKEASKFWDGASMDDQQVPGDEKTISFNEAKRSGLVPEDK